MRLKEEGCICSGISRRIHGDVAVENGFAGWTGFHRRGHTLGSGNDLSKGTEQDSHAGLVRVGGIMGSLSACSSL